MRIDLQSVRAATVGWKKVGSNSIEVDIHHLRKELTNEV